MKLHAFLLVFGSVAAALEAIAQPLEAAPDCPIALARPTRQFQGLAAFTAKTGFDHGSRQGDPGLVDPAKGDWRPSRSGLA